MPVFPLFALFLTVIISLFLINDLLFFPLYLAQGLSLPRWIGIGLLLVFFSWLFGE